MKDIDKRLDEILLDDIYDMLSPKDQEYTKQSIKSLISDICDEAVGKAKIDELEQLMPPEQYKYYAKIMGVDACPICGFNSELFRRHIEDRIAGIRTDILNKSLEEGKVE